MGRYFYNRKTTVEETLAFNIKRIKDDGLLKNSVYATSTWTNRGQKIGSVGYFISIDGNTGSITFSYTNTNGRTGEKTDMNYKAGLVSTPCNFGGRRWWFICPLKRNGHPCLKRVSVLYLDGKYFGCRHCHNLTYQSCQDSHKFDRIYAMIGISPHKGRRLFERNHRKRTKEEEILADRLLYKLLPKKIKIK